MFRDLVRRVADTGEDGQCECRQQRGADTGWFRFASTSADTYRLAGLLVDAGATPDLLYKQLYEGDTLGRMRLIGRTLARAQAVRSRRSKKAGPFHFSGAENGLPPRVQYSVLPRGRCSLGQSLNNAWSACWSASED